MDFWLNLVGIEDELENEIVEKEEVLSIRF
jgi:hypothetical protein